MKNVPAHNQPQSPWKKEIGLAIEVATKAGRFLMENFEGNYPIIRKSVKELVAKIDVDVQRIILDILTENFPQDHLFSEEKRFTGEITERTWVIDPIDGTHNYIAGLPNFGVSIGLISPEGFHLGVLFFPALNQLIHGVENHGSFLNGKRIHVSMNNDISKSMIAYDNQFHLAADSFARYQRINDRAFTTRILGAASYDIGLIACGKMDARIWNATKLVDIAAGVAILREAGGKISDFSNEPLGFKPQDVIFSNGAVHNQLIELVNI